MTLFTRQAATERALAAAARSQASVTGNYVWNFGFGANIDPTKLRVKRGIAPAEVVPGKLAGWRLLFNQVIRSGRCGVTI